MLKKTLFFAFFLALTPYPLLSQSIENVKNPGIYVVKKGDCLWNISKKVWGDPTKWPLIFATNEAKIHNPNLIYPGQKFTIPTTITREDLNKAVLLAQERTEPLPGWATEAKASQTRAHHKSHATTPPNESASSASASKSSPSNAAPSNTGAEKTENASSPPATAPEGQTSGTTTASTGGFPMALVGGILLVAIGGGLFLLLRKRGTGPSEMQRPRPLSSFPPTEGKPVNPSPQTPTPVVSPSQKPPESVIPVPAVKPEEPRPTVEAKPPVFTGTPTSISTSQPPTPSKAEPATPTVQAPVTPAPPANPPIQQAPENKPPDTTPNPPTGDSPN